MNAIVLVPGANVEATVLDVMERCVSRTFGVPTRRAPSLPEPAGAYDPQRKQYSSTDLLQLLVAQSAPPARRVLGVTTYDIFIPMLSFIFGQAQLGGRAALVSVARLRQEFYGLPADEPLLHERACKEAIHELGHTFGLTHCHDTTCAMSLSVTIEQVDGKRPAFCGSCRTLLRDAMDAMDEDAPDGGRDREDRA